MPLPTAEAWYGALTLKERLATGGGHRSVTDRERKRLADWRSQPPFDKDDMFNRRLAETGAGEGEWLAAFARSTEDLAHAQGEPPTWVTRLHELSRGAKQPVDLDLDGRGGPMGGFFVIVRPFLEDACRRLEVAAASRWGQQAPFPIEGCARLLLGYLPERMLEMCSRTLVLELNIARLQGLLSGETPQERYHSYVAYLREGTNTWSLLADYPVLARRLLHAADTWMAAGLAFSQDLAADIDAIAAHFGGHPGQVTEVSGGAGDAHRGGRSVRIVTFQSGLKLVYKPRSSAVDDHFQDLLRWLNARGAAPDFPLMQVLDRGDHGWQEFIAPKACDGEAEIARFYERVGAFLALFHVLEATDFHFENLIARGEYPYPVDLETLFHPRLHRPEIDWPDVRITSEAVGASVLRVGILPFRIGEMADNPGLDISGLASVEGQMSPDPILQWQDMATDEMRADRQRVQLPAGQNKPRLSDREADTLAYAGRIVDGFRQTWRLLRAHRDELLAADGPIAAFAGDQVRAVLRPTRAYHLILAESCHPDLMRDALLLERHFDRLWSGLDKRPQLLAVVAAERTDLAAGDIPLFTTRPDSMDLWTSDDACRQDYFGSTPMAAVHTRIDQLDEENLQRQVWFIEASLGTLALSRDDLDWPSYTLVEPDALPAEDELSRGLLARAVAAGERLEELAFQSEGEATWVGLTFAKDRWSLVTLMEDLYSGTPGIILFLAQLGEAASMERFTKLARCATETLRARLTHTRDEIKTLGFFQGWGSLIYLFTHLGHLWRDDALLAEADACLDALDPLIEQDGDLDLIGGGAGCIMALLAYHRVTGSSRALALAVRCGDHLLARGEEMAGGIAWPTPVGEGLPLLGFSHGSAGFAHALFALAEATGEPRFRDGAMAAGRYEHVTLAALRNQSEEEKAERRPGEVQALAVAWCYGSAGVGMARLQALRSADEPWLHQDLDEAVAQTLADGFGRNHSLCHGDLGNLDFILQAQRRLGDASLARECRRLAAIILESMDTHGFRCGTPLCVEAPSLMNGLAGIGHGLLRAALPDHIPSILACEPPHMP